ncbi:AAA family ATPase [Maritimibacter sp. UBA3975]|uniref:AAA family ATPase n=1 Tax=Maritimibacter sp. UBA3975 TaxID=1946833 RepID=UPI000C0941A0|nr:AAA family ATPase [Maritimibacter sp. UBA3975]MAM60092.1 chromosome segregation protein SMC [Maritimibacter sp.]|tara:strand:+ start:3952 stop:7677 length:3726 start_codon:yes stop_codon:yes gene_type:complete
MQILSIRGENIASLAKLFEIRLDAPPLSSAGLFAITGETGAGKSSLLDALCLALYGNCPRLSGDGTSEAVADIGGQELRSTDARMVLRRGVASGFAEVTFRAADGETYVAGWQARRARDRIDGRLQAIERSLARGADGQMLETQISRVNERVVGLTGLTYDEFRRTVLLAQGDFAAFLDARTQERAAILEKVTGTGIYRDISRRVFERNRVAVAELATLETRRGEHQLLSPEERTEVADRITTLRAEQGAAVTALEAVRKDLAQYAAVEAAEANLAKAKARLDAAERAQAELGDDRVWLADWDRAQALRGEVRERGDANRALDMAREDHARITGELATQKGLVAEAQTRFDAAKVARDEAERVFKAFAPVWDQASALDERVAGAVDEHATAATALDEARRAEAGAQEVLAELVAEEGALKDAVAEAERVLAAVRGHEVLLANRSLIEERLGARIEQARLATTSDAEAQEMAETIVAERERRQALEADAKAARGEIDAAREAQEAIADERKRLTEAAPGARLERLAQAEADLRNLRAAAHDVRLADRALADSQDRCAKARTLMSEQTKIVEAARAEQKVASELVQALRQPSEAASAAASREAEHLRQHLVDGTPCPVCGATAHPVMADGEIATLAEDLRNRLTEAQDRSNKSETTATQAALRIEAAETTIKAETERAPDLRAQVAEAETGYARASKPLEDGLLAGELPEGPRAEDALFDALAARLARWRAGLEVDRDRLAALDRAHREADALIDAAKARITEGEDRIREIAEVLTTKEREIARVEQARDTAQGTIAEIDRRLAPLLEPTEIRAEAFGPDATLDDLRATFMTLDAARDTIEATRKSLADLSTSLAKAQADASGARMARERAEATERSRCETLERLRADRAQLLGGEETGPHRTRHNTARTTAQAAFDDAREVLDNSARAETALASTLAAADKAQTGAAARVTAAEAALTAACEAAGIAEAHLLALHATETATVEARRQALRSADTERAAAQGAMQERDNECATLKAEGLPDTPKPELETAKATMETETQSRGETLGGLSQKLEADAVAAKALAGLEAEIESARKTAETWAAVNDAVGSAKGDRFAQIAQAVTLALLVERANLHLDDLKPRYQLKVAASDLALHIIDRDMADDARPTRLLSGGERFLVSLALALALSGMGTRGVLAGTLFIDEGFGSLDSGSLDLAIDALERLQAQGRTIGVISHVQAMKDRIPVQLQVQKTGGGASEIDLVVR